MNLLKLWLIRFIIENIKVTIKNLAKRLKVTIKIIITEENKLSSDLNSLKLGPIKVKISVAVFIDVLNTYYFYFESKFEKILKILL